jgi:hypothetical protein
VAQRLLDGTRPVRVHSPKETVSKEEKKEKFAAFEPDIFLSAESLATEV